jgi:hypothetical protein
MGRKARPIFRAGFSAHPTIGDNLFLGKPLAENFNQFRGFKSPGSITGKFCVGVKSPLQNCTCDLRLATCFNQFYPPLTFDLAAFSPVVLYSTLLDDRYKHAQDESNRLHLP